MGRMGYRFQAVSINAARAVYALNWFNIAPGLTYIASDLKLEIVQLGIITTAFYLGLASFQLFGGVVASRIGNRRTETFGLVVLGVSVIASGLSTNLPELFITRFAAGAGSAFFFSPALGMLSEIVPDEKYGFYVGTFNGAFNIGAGAGVLGWVFVDQYLGWRAGLIIGGLMTIALALENYAVLRGVVVHTSRGKDLFGKLRKAVTNRAMWLLPIAGIGSMAAETIMGQLFVYYGETGLHYSPSLAGTLGFIFLITGFFGGVIGGIQYSRTRHGSATFVGVLAITAILVLMIPFVRSPVPLGLLVTALGLVVVDGFSILYTIAARLAPDKSTISFSLSFVNFMQQAIGASFPFIFTGITHAAGYSVSWLVLGAISSIAIFLYPLARTPPDGVSRGTSHMAFNKTK